MNGKSKGVGLAICALATAFGLIAAKPARSECPLRPVERSACPADHRFEGGACHTGPNWLGYRAFCPIDRCNVCTTNETLDSARGVCVSREATVRVGRPACPASHRFEGGACHTGPNWLGYRAFCPI